MNDKAKKTSLEGWDKPVRQRLVISLDEATTLRYLAEAARKTQAEVNVGCMPSGASLQIDVCPPFGNSLSMLIGKDWVEIGEVDVELKTLE
jgi:hypothetical protein